MDLLTRLQQDVDMYCVSLTQFLESHDLKQFITDQVDHMAIKMIDSEAFDAYLLDVEPLSTSLEYVTEGGRRLATAYLTQPITFGDYGETVLLEIMEPRPHKAGKDLVGFEHTEFYYPDLQVVKSFLDKQGFVYEDYSNSFHAAVACIINPQNQEVKFTNTGLIRTIQRQREASLMVVVK